MAVISGAWCRPVNTSADEKGGIHDDATAQNLGFQGGTIAGSIHMEQFVPLLVEHFGEQWWSRGGMSLYFLAATVDHEPVQCKVESVAPERAKIWMERENGDLVMQGTASLGPDQDSELNQRLKTVRPASDIRILRHVVIDKLSARHPVNMPAASIDERLAVITESLPCYANSEQFGGRVLPPAPFVHAFRVVEQEIAPLDGPFVGMFGAIELQYLNGPVFAERDYSAIGRVLAVSESPKTEILWYEATLRDVSSQQDVARMIKMDRLMKAASPHWADAEVKSS